MYSYNNPDRLPTTFVFNRAGKQVFSQIGEVHESQLSSLLDQLASQN
jgi:hypothetical protein